MTNHLRIIKLLIVTPFLTGVLIRFSLFSPDINVYWTDLAVLLLFLFQVKNSGLVVGHNTGLFKKEAPFLFVCFISLILNFSRFGIASLMSGFAYLVRFFTYTYLWIHYVQMIKPNFIRNFLSTIGIGIAAVGIGQYLFFPDMRSLGLEWDPHYYRLVGTLLDPNFTGLLLVFTILFISSVSLRLSHFFLAYAALALTYSRSSYLALAAGMGYLLWRRRSPGLALLLAVLMLSTYFFLPRPPSEGTNLARTTSFFLRLDNWQSTLDLFVTSPIIGHGFNLLRYAKLQSGELTSDNWQTIHSGAGADMSLLFVLATTGLYGLVTFGYFGYHIWKIPDQTYLIKSSLVSLVVHSFFQNSIFFPLVLLWLGLAIALIRGTQPQFLSGSGSQTDQLPKKLTGSHR